MKVIDIEKKENNLLACKVQIDADAYAEATNKAYQRAKKDITVPGFRKGKAPLSVIEGMYGKDIFQQEAIESLSKEIMLTIVGDPRVEPLDDPTVVNVEMDDEDNCVVECNVHTFPRAKLGQYKGIEITREIAEVSDEAVDKEIDNIRQRSARFETVNRPAIEGDTCIVDFVGYLDGVPFEGGKGDNYTLVIGSHNFIPGFEEQLVGISAGETKEIAVTFPTHYHVSSLAGKPATFTVTCREVKGSSIAAIDDDFVRDVSEFNTVDEFREDQRSKLRIHENSRIYTDFLNELLDKAAANMTDYEIPEEMIEKSIHDFSENIKKKNGATGVEDDVFCGYIGIDKDTYYANIRPAAEAQVKTDILLHEVAMEENIQVTKEDIEAGYAEYAKQFMVSEPYLRDMLSPASMCHELLTRRAKNIIEESAIVTDVTKDVKEAERAAARERLRAEYEAKQEAEKKAAEEAETEKTAETETAEEPKADAE